jgi:hypothetical protein
MPARRRTPRPRARRPAFTLIETAMAVIIIGVGVVAMVDAQRAFMISNAWSSQAATATLLANEIRELTRNLSRHDPVTGLSLDGTTIVGWGPENGEDVVSDYDDIDDFDGVQFGGTGADLPGPINAYGDVIPALNIDGSTPTDDAGAPMPMAGWSQRVLVEKVSPFNPATVEPPDTTEPPSGSFGGRDVDEYPVRVTVIVSYLAPGATEPEEVISMTWIVPVE